MVKHIALFHETQILKTVRLCDRMPWQLWKVLWNRPQGL